MGYAAQGDWVRTRDDAAEALRKPDGVTKKALFQMARADLRLKNLEGAEETLQLATQHKLRKEIEKLLRDDGLLSPDDITPRSVADLPEADRAAFLDEMAACGGLCAPELASLLFPGTCTTKQHGNPFLHD